MAEDPFLTLVILVTGVIGGLVVVILVIIFCKYRLKRKVTLRRRQVVERERPRDLPQLKPLLTCDSPESLSIQEELEAAFIRLSPHIPRKTTISPLAFGNKGCTLLLNGGRNEPLSVGLPSTSMTIEDDIVCPWIKNEPKHQHISTSSSDSPANDEFNTCDRLPEQYKTEDHTAADVYHTIPDSPLHELLGAHGTTPEVPVAGDWSGGSEDELVKALVASLAEQRSSGSSSESAPVNQKQILVEVYDQPKVRKSSADECRNTHRALVRKTSAPTPTQRAPHVGKHKKACHSKSADIVQISRAPRLTETRKYFSYDDAGIYDTLRITEFNSGPFYTVDFGLNEDSAVDSVKACVRYNDPGSIEQLDEHFEFYEPDTSDSREEVPPPLLSATKYRDIWKLRATFEEEEECSDTIRLQDTTSPEPSPDECADPPAICDVPKTDDVEKAPQCTGDGNCCSTSSQPDAQPSPSEIDASLKTDTSEASPLIPSGDASASRQPKLRSIYKRKLPSRGNSADTSFDSFETVETDGDGEVSDATSRHGCTTSFDSTDNTDSTTDSRLKQMRGDSGYKSMENPPVPETSAKKLSFSLDVESYEYERPVEASPKQVVRKTRRHSHIERSGKTASKRRREYRREPHALQLYESIKEPEEFLPREGSEDNDKEDIEDSTVASKFSVFSRFFRSHGVHKSPRTRSLQRDYSMDEKTSKLFNDFMRIDTYPVTDTKTNIVPSGSQRRASPNCRRADRLAPEKRSASESSASSRRLSPQDSIEEEFELDETTLYSRPHPSLQEVMSHETIHEIEIPTINLPEEEAT